MGNDEHTHAKSHTGYSITNVSCISWAKIGRQGRYLFVCRVPRGSKSYPNDPRLLYYQIMSNDSFGTRTTLSAGGNNYSIYSLETLAKAGFELERMPFSIKVMLENLLRREDGVVVTREQIERLARWTSSRGRDGDEISFMPARVLLQDFTGVPVVADLAAMREAIRKLGGDPARINPLQPADLVIDHSVQVDAFGSSGAFAINAELEFERNQERYQFLRWGQGAFDNFRVVPPDTGIVHQVNLEYLAPVVFTSSKGEAYPDTVLGTDSHTTMVNGLGVVGDRK